MKLSSFASRLRRPSLWNPFKAPVATFKASCKSASSFRRSLFKAAAASSAFLLSTALAASPLRLVRAPCSATVAHSNTNAKRRLGFSFRPFSSQATCPAVMESADVSILRAEKPYPEALAASPADPAQQSDPQAGEASPEAAAAAAAVEVAQDMRSDNEPDSIPEPPAPPHWQGQGVFRDTVSFNLTEGCALVLHIGDITKWGVDGRTDAVVNAANERMLGGGGVDGAIHRAAGPELLRMCRAAPEVEPGIRCPTGAAVTTGAGELPVKHVVHTVGPIYDSVADPAALLSSAYRSSMEEARSKGIKYIAFPAISCGIYGYPAREAAEVSIRTVQGNSESVKEVHFVLFSPKEHTAWLKAAQLLLPPVEAPVS